MKNDDLSGEEARELKTRARRTEDYQDSIAESSGRDRGKRLRFLSEDQTPKGRDARQQERRQQQDRLQTFTLTMQQRMQQLQTRLDQLDRASLEALREAERRAEEARQSLDRIRADADIAPDGRKVYFSKDGKRAIYDDLTELTAAERAAVQRRPGATTMEQRIQAGQVSRTAVENVQRIQEFRDDLQNAQEAVDRGELSADELANVVEDLGAKAPASVIARARENLPPRTSAAREHLRDADNTLTTKHAFNQAGSGEPITQARNDRAPPQPTEAPRRP